MAEMMGMHLGWQMVNYLAMHLGWLMARHLGLQMGMRWENQWALQSEDGLAKYLGYRRVKYWG